MRRLALTALALLLPSLALAQSNPTTGFSSGVVHGQRPDMRQDLHNAPGAPTAGGGASAPQSRTQQLRQRSQTTQATQQQQQRRAAQQRRHAQEGQAARTQRTGGGTPAARSPDTMAAQEARMADARRRQAEAQRQAADRQDGVALGRRPLGQ
jgi:hypothetical protein